MSFTSFLTIILLSNANSISALFRDLGFYCEPGGMADGIYALPKCSVLYGIAHRAYTANSYVYKLFFYLQTEAQ